VLTITAECILSWSDEINSLRQLSDALKLDLREATDLNARQETLISTLKEETSVLSEVGAELTELKRKCKDLSQLNEEQGQTISNLKKVWISYFLNHFSKPSICNNSKVCVQHHVYCVKWGTVIFLTKLAHDVLNVFAVNLCMSTLSFATVIYLTVAFWLTFPVPAGGGAKGTTTEKHEWNWCWFGDR